MPIMAAVFGAESIEIAQEMFKWCSLLYNSNNNLKTTAIVDRTITLFETLGIRGEDLEELRYMRSNL
jgi:hypothetical protein